MPMTNLRNQKVSPSAPADASSRIDYPDAWRMALVAIAVVGVGFFLCHLPYGRLATVLLCLAGAALAALSVLGLERRPWLGWIGVGLNLLFVVLLVAFLVSLVCRDGGRYALPNRPHQPPA